MTARQLAQQQWSDRAQKMLLLGLLIFCGAIYLLALRPALNRLRETSERTAIEQAELTGNQIRASNLPAVQRQVAGLRQKVAGIKQLPPSPDLARFIDDVTNMSRVAPVRRLVWKNDSQPRRGELFTELPIQFAFEGDYAGLFEFLRRTEELPRLTRIRKLDVRSKDGKTGQVLVQMTLSIFFTAE